LLHIIALGFYLPCRTACVRSEEHAMPTQGLA
jgi:hypothetical protein